MTSTGNNKNINKPNTSVSVSKHLSSIPTKPQSNPTTIKKVPIGNNQSSSNLKTDNKFTNKKTWRPESSSTKKQSSKPRKVSSSYSSSGSYSSSYDEDGEYSDSGSYSSSSSSYSSSSQSIKHKEKEHKKNQQEIKRNKSTEQKKSQKINKVSSVKKSNSHTTYTNKNQKELKPKSLLVYQLLKRWWYALPIWPPENLDVSDQLSEQKWRLVQLENWKKEPIINNKGYTKCFGVPGFKYVFLDSNCKAHDFRPLDNKPSYSNLMKKDEKELSELLVKAIKKQIEELTKENRIQDTETLKNLKEELRKAEINLNKLK